LICGGTYNDSEDALEFQLDGASYKRKTQCSLSTYFEQTYVLSQLLLALIGGFASSFVFADYADSRSESVTLFGLQSISLWLNLLSVRFIPVFLFLLLSVPFAVYVLDWWHLL